MPLTPADITRTYTDDGSSLERLAHRKHPPPLSIVPPNPLWAQRFLMTKSRISTALSPTPHTVHHIGSTSIPTLPAKDIIDIDLVVPDIHDEASYAPALQRAGFTFLFREPAWHHHRFFIDEGDPSDPTSAGFAVNLHVFGPECPEVEKHRIFREWLAKSPDDLELYARTKRECARETVAKGEYMQEYTDRKAGVVREILHRAFRDLGYVE